MGFYFTWKQILNRIKIMINNVIVGLFWFNKKGDGKMRMIYIVTVTPDHYSGLAVIISNGVGVF